MTLPAIYRAPAALALATVVTTAFANMGGTASDHGLLPHDVATAQALSIFNTQTSSVYYNPSRLAADERGELTGGIFHAEHDLKAESLGGDAPRQRDGDTLNSTPSEQLMLGLKTDLSKLTTSEHPLYLGFLVGAEKHGRELLAFNAETAKEGQFLRYDRQPLFLSLGVGTTLWRGIDIGLAARVMLRNRATLFTQSTLAGDTEQERLHVSAEPVPSPIIGMSINMGETFCDVQNCRMDRLDIALAWRGQSGARVDIDTETEVPGTVQNPGLPIVINALDSFQPDITTLGIRYRLAGGTTVGLTGEYQAWRQLEDELDDDTIRDQSNARFRNILIPRVGVSHELTDHLTLKAGIAAGESPLRDGRTPDVNYLDSDRLVLGLGGSAQLPRVPLLAHPVRLDFGYQYQRLEKRDFELSSTDPAEPQPHEKVRASGGIHVFTGSATLKF